VRSDSLVLSAHPDARHSVKMSRARRNIVPTMVLDTRSRPVLWKLSSSAGKPGNRSSPSAKINSPVSSLISPFKSS